LSQKDDDNSIDGIRRKVKERIKKEDKKLSELEPDKPNKPEITSKFVRDCFYAGELGNGILFAAIFRNKFVFNKSENRWYFFNGQNWEPDIMNKAQIAVEKVAECYLDEALRVSGQINQLMVKND